MVKLLENQDIVLTCFEEAGLRLNKAKCKFITDSGKYLEFLIDAITLNPTDDMVKAIFIALAPTNVAELRARIRLYKFYSKFVPDQATLLAPLYALFYTMTPLGAGVNLSPIRSKK